MQPVVVPPRSSQTRSVLARLLVRVSGYGIFTDVTRLMTLRTSSRSAAETGIHAAPNGRIISIRYAGFWSIGNSFPCASLHRILQVLGLKIEARITACRGAHPIALNPVATHQGI